MTYKESYFASQHILMRAILMAQRTPAAGFADTGIEKAAAKSAPAGKYKISVNPVILSNVSSFLCAFCAFLWLKNPRNLRNPRLINDLRLFKALYNCRGHSTNVVGSLQIKLFMQNKAKFKKVKLGIKHYNTMNYDKKDTWLSGKKQSQTKPNKPKLKKVRMNVTSILTKGYENKPPIRAPKKQSQISKRQKTMQTSLPQGIMKKTAFSYCEKTNPNKPNLSRRSLWRSRKQTQCLPAICVVGQTAHCQIGLLPCIFCVDMAGLRRKHVTYYPGRVYNRMMWLAGCQRTEVSRSKKHVVLLWRS